VNDSAELKLLGQRIREKRKAKQWTQETLADRALIDRSYIGGVERGERNITFTVLCQIAKALDDDIAELTHGIPGAES
jgi:transcriptional regulator with XRE-family HTH domain